MNCDRCKEWHQRTVIFENDIGVNHEPRNERLCLTCLANLMFGRVSIKDEKNRLVGTLKSLLSDVSNLSKKVDP
jgi:hypothetical protein